jgi:hypothetical protein
MDSKLVSPHSILDSILTSNADSNLDSNPEIESEVTALVWGYGMLSEGKQYIVETKRGYYKGTYKKPEIYIPYVILYNVTNNEKKYPHMIFYNTDSFYNADEFIYKLKKRLPKVHSMEKRGLAEILRQITGEIY